LSKALTTDIGIQPLNATLTKFDLAQAAYTGDSAAQFQQQLQRRLLQLPGVEAVGYANATPLADQPDATIFPQDATDFRRANQVLDTYAYNISPGYLAAAGTPLLAGRDFQPTDNAGAPRVAIVDRQFARTVYHSDNAIGRYFKNHDGALIQIVGMVADGKYFLISEDTQEVVYFPILQQPGTGTEVVVRTRPGVSGMAATVRNTIHQLDPAIAIRSSAPWISQLAFSFFPAQVATVSLGLFGAFGLLLSITGTFGLASYTVSKRMRELSIRVALGAPAREILSAALGRLLSLIATGSVIGMSLGFATSHLLSHVVFQATAQDPLVFTAVILTLLLTAILSVAGPVRRALHADPAALLREQ
jgi:ABC-type antimicrobial peptide transport system permease subunit